MEKFQFDFVKLILENTEIRKEGEVLLVWLKHYHMAEFNSLVGSDYFCEGDLECTFLGDCVCFDLVPILEFMDIDINCILESEGE